MNERIKKLAEMYWFVNEHMTPGEKSDALKKYQKFAELIIQECISIVEEQKECLCEEQQYWSDHDYGYEMAVDDASKGIKQFFGVEE